MTPKEVKLQIIQNFIEYHTTDEDERMDLIGEAQNYVDEDWVDEITQAGYAKKQEDPKPEPKDDWKVDKDAPLIVQWFQRFKMFKS